MTSVVAGRGPALDLSTVLRADLAEARRQLARARSQQCGKDTPSHRGAVAEAHDVIDRLLDLYLETCETEP